MHQKINEFSTYLREKVTIKIAVVAFVLLTIFITGSVYAARAIGLTSSTITPPSSEMAGAEDNVNNEDANIAIVGDDSALFGTQLENSWPGEVVSYGTIPVQPGREGTIVDWRVKIGDRVRAGQVLAMLSAPPASSDLVQMLAEQAEQRARMRAQATATKRFTEINNTQLRTLLKTTESTTNDSKDILVGINGQSGTAENALTQARDATSIMRKNLRTTAEQMLKKHMIAVSNKSIISSFQFGSVNAGFGLTDPQSIPVYEERFMKLVNELKNADALPVEATTSYFNSFIRLANSGSTGDNTNLIGMARDDNEKFFDMLANYRDAESAITMKEAEYALMAKEKTQEYADQKKEVEEKIAENEKMSAMAEAESLASNIAYGTVAHSILGGLSITAPRSGTISTINKNVGDFVGPGMPVASIDTVRISERFVRLQIPSNVLKPKAGDIFSVVRPGFSQDVKKIKLTGVGTSLDVTGSYMADASFLSTVDWPVASSVRVLVSDTSTVPLIKLSSVWFDASGSPNVWGVSDARRIFARKIKIGRTIGANVEVYEGLKKGDRYVAVSSLDFHEDMILESPKKIDSSSGSANPSDEKKPMGGMEM